jgi:hypothetical protein
MNNKEQAAEWWGKFIAQREKRGPFKRALVRLLPDGDWDLYNDYDPWGLLLEAIRESGIECRGFGYSGREIGFPDKAGLRCKDGCLEAKVGRFAEYIEVDEPTWG